jgi:hypothetical protein
MSISLPASLEQDFYLSINIHDGRTLVGYPDTVE